VCVCGHHQRKRTLSSVYMMETGPNQFIMCIHKQENVFKKLMTCNQNKPKGKENREKIINKQRYIICILCLSKKQNNLFTFDPVLMSHEADVLTVASSLHITPLSSLRGSKRQNISSFIYSIKIYLMRLVHFSLFNTPFYLQRSYDVKLRLEDMNSK
jgi:hypothetical protein